MYLDGFVSFVSFCSGCLEEEVTFSQLGPTFSLQLFRVEASECTICLHQLQSSCISYNLLASVAHRAFRL